MPAKHVLPEGADDGQLLSFSRDHDRTVLTADMQFTIVDGTVITNHAGVIFAPQSMLQSRPADAGEAVNRILELVPPDERVGKEFYLEHWLDRR